MTQPFRQNIEKIEKIKAQSEQLKTHACQIVISCSEPTSDGKMDVELTYHGDPTLAMFLLENAKDYFENQIDEHFSD